VGGKKGGGEGGRGGGGHPRRELYPPSSDHHQPSTPSLTVANASGARESWANLRFQLAAQLINI